MILERSVFEPIIFSKALLCCRDVTTRLKKAFETYNAKSTVNKLTTTKFLYKNIMTIRHWFCLFLMAVALVNRVRIHLSLRPV